MKRVLCAQLPTEKSMRLEKKCNRIMAQNCRQYHMTSAINYLLFLFLFSFHILSPPFWWRFDSIRMRQAVDETESQSVQHFQCYFDTCIARVQYSFNVVKS